jgi:6-pyruvoyltetrahydropterin/6-carboxytetrahydropterin synthase
MERNLTVIRAHRYHSIAYGHRVYQHESKCGHLHGHNGEITFYCEADQLDSVGRVIDFSVIKSTLCKWIEDNWDHKFLVYEKDPWAEKLLAIDPTVVVVPFNPTSENMADFLLNTVGPTLLGNTGVELVRVVFFETPKCGVEVELEVPSVGEQIRQMGRRFDNEPEQGF